MLSQRVNAPVRCGRDQRCSVFCTRIIAVWQGFDRALCRTEAMLMPPARPPAVPVRLQGPGCRQEGEHALAGALAAIAGASGHLALIRRTRSAPGRQRVQSDPQVENALANRDRCCFGAVACRRLPLPAAPWW
jgi:hypothetical protein